MRRGRGCGRRREEEEERWRSYRGGSTSLLSGNQQLMELKHPDDGELLS